MSYEAIKRVFIELVLPQQFAFRKISDRIYIPDYIDKISLPVFGRKMFFADAVSNEDDYGSFIVV